MPAASYRRRINFNGMPGLLVDDGKAPLKELQGLGLFAHLDLLASLLVLHQDVSLVVHSSCLPARLPALLQLLDKLGRPDCWSRRAWGRPRAASGSLGGPRRGQATFCWPQTALQAPFSPIEGPAIPPRRSHFSKTYPPGCHPEKFRHELFSTLNKGSRGKALSVCDGREAT